MTLAHDIVRSNLQIAASTLHAVGRLNVPLTEGDDDPNLPEYERIVNLLMIAADTGGLCTNEGASGGEGEISVECHFVESRGHFCINLFTGEVSDFMPFK
ncbi:MAG: hypothetical protein EON60_10375 [Alphaproteobacteria bacterium]|nr:MAG: hypothetical protein EON60_10375 [Alphaproteobacteria bacterium]